MLYDPSVTSILKAPDVTNEENWHKLVELDELSSLVERLTSLETELAELDTRIKTLEDDSDVITYGYRSGFPPVGEANKLYIAADEEKSYIWFNNDYLPVSGTDSSYEEPDIICGGSADNE